jgi:hypothetical protein
MFEEAPVLPPIEAAVIPEWDEGNHFFDEGDEGDEEDFVNNTFDGFQQLNVAYAKATDCDPSLPLFPGSRKTGKDLARTLSALKANNLTMGDGVVEAFMSNVYSTQTYMDVKAMADPDDYII